MKSEIVLITVIVSAVVLVLSIRIAFDITMLSDTLKHINCVIGRTDGAEREHWKRVKKRLWLSFFFPFLR